MKYISRASNYGHNLHVVQLEGDEVNYSDAKLMHMADNGYQVRDWWPEVEKGLTHPGHFGGTVERFDDGTAKIKIYID